MNNEIYNSLPSNLKNGIISTKVISGYYEGSTDYICETNDALYLFSSKEVYGTIPTYGNFPMDAKYGNEEDTRQLDYFNSIGVTKNNYSGAIKEYNDATTNWWLRSVTKMLSSSDNYDYFTIAGNNGKYFGNYADNNSGVAPAFRIG